jgi:exosortase/archaeosortase family protein
MSADALGADRMKARHRAGRRLAGPPWASASESGSGEPGLRRAARLGTAVTLMVIAALVPSQEPHVRDLEAWIASHVIAVCGVQTGYLGGSLPMAWFAESTDLHVGLIITPDCTIAMLTIPFLVAAALLVWRRAPLRRTITGLAVALILLEALNQARLLTIAGTILVMGYPSGYYWGHTMFGSILLVLGTTAILAVFAIFVLRRGNGGRIQ